MDNATYPWKRFWYPRGATINLEEGAYLSDPEADYASWYNPNVVSFDGIESRACLVLLGEPGSGKSHAIQVEYTGVSDRLAGTTDVSFLLDLRSINSELRLNDKLFRDPRFVAWDNGSHVLHLFIDSLDECLLDLNTAARIIAEDLRLYSPQRLRLRIACRTVGWPVSIESPLRSLWGKLDFGVYVLAPLRRKDVAVAAQVEGLDPERFLTEVSERGVAPLAARPVTLKFLLSVFAHDGRLPESQTSLYHLGCLQLCQESQDREDAQHGGEYAAEQRMAVASRIAAVTALCNRSAVWIGADLRGLPPEDVPISSLVGGQEWADREEFIVSRDAVRESLGTALFSSREAGRREWEHRTYAEYLAAHYLSKDALPARRMMALLVNQEDPEKRIVPQLHSLAGWIGALAPSVFRVILATEPEVLVQSNAPSPYPKLRCELVDTWLARLERVPHLCHEVSVHYRNFRHPTLGLQLRAYIADETRPLVVRAAALEIAGACELPSLETLLLRITLEPHHHYDLRTRAAHMILRIGDESAKRALKPLVIGEHPEDTDDELKGCALRALWPDCLSATELFAALTRPKSAHYYGSYESFVSQRLPETINIGNLPIALKWVAGQSARYGLNHSFQQLVDTILEAGWKNLDGPGVCEAFAEAAVSRFRQHDQLMKPELMAPFREEAARNAEKRRQLVIAILRAVNCEEDRQYLLLIGPASIAQQEDLGWLIEQLGHSETQDIRAVLCQFIALKCDWYDQSQRETVMAASQVHLDLRTEIAGILKPVEIESETATKAREHYYTMQQLARETKERETRREQAPPFDQKEEMEEVLRRCADGEIGLWRRLCYVMGLNPDQEDQSATWWEPDLTHSRGWQMADQNTQELVIETAKAFVLCEDGGAANWDPGLSWPYEVIAFYKALRLLLSRNKEWMVRLAHAAWSRLAGVIVGCPTWAGGDTALDVELRQLAYEHAPEAVIAALGGMMDKANESDREPMDRTRLHAMWDARLQNAILTRLHGTDLKPQCFRWVLRVLLEHNVDDAWTYSLSLVQSPMLFEANVRRRTAAAAVLLLWKDARRAWPDVWAAMQEDDEFGKTVLRSLVNETLWLGEERRENILVGRIADNELANLYIWATHQIPPREPPNGFFGPDDHVRVWAGRIIEHLKSKATEESLSALRRICDAFPDFSGLAFNLREADRKKRESDWRPLSPHELFSLLEKWRLHRSSQVLVLLSGSCLLIGVITWILTDSGAAGFVLTFALGVPAFFIGFVKWKSLSRLRLPLAVIVSLLAVILLFLIITKLCSLGRS